MSMFMIISIKFLSTILAANSLTKFNGNSSYSINIQLQYSNTLINITIIIEYRGDTAYKVLALLLLPNSMTIL